MVLVDILPFCLTVGTRERNPLFHLVEESLPPAAGQWFWVDLCFETSSKVTGNRRSLVSCEHSQRRACVLAISLGHDWCGGLRKPPPLARGPIDPRDQASIGRFLANCPLSTVKVELRSGSVQTKSWHNKKLQEFKLSEFACWAFREGTPPFFNMSMPLSAPQDGVYFSGTCQAALPQKCTVVYEATATQPTWSQREDHRSLSAPGSIM